MALEVRCDQKEGYLHFTVRGENTPANIIAYLQEIREKCIELNCFSVLVEEYLAGPGLSIMAVYKLVTEGSKRHGNIVKRFAYIDANHSHIKENMEFAETVAVNLGMNVRLFETVADAEAWLKKIE
jgi:hypothetical protein